MELYHGYVGTNSTQVVSIKDLVEVPNPTKLVIILLGVAYLLILILSDALAAIASKPRVHWIPGKALILSALSIQILIFLDYKNMDILPGKNVDPSDKPQDYDKVVEFLARLVSNQLISDSGRLVICVFIGYLLPEMARRGSGTDWRNIVALVVSLFSAVTSEFYYTPQVLELLGEFRIIESYPTYLLPLDDPFPHDYVAPTPAYNSTVSPMTPTPAYKSTVSPMPPTPAYKSTVSTIAPTPDSHCFMRKCLRSPNDILYSTRTISPAVTPTPDTFAVSLKPRILEDGHTIADLVAWETMVLFVSTILLVLLLVSAIIAGKTVRGLLSERISVIQKKSGKSMEKFEDDVLRSWLLSSVGQPQYFIARSVLTSAVGMVVSGFIAFSLLQGLNLRSLMVFKYYCTFNWLWKATFWLQCAFVLVGWVVILWRWFTALFYFPKDYSRRSLRVEYYWTRSIFEEIYMYDMHKWRLKEKTKHAGISSSFNRFLFRVCTSLKLHQLLRLIWVVQIGVVFFSNVCWFISYTLFTALRSPLLCFRSLQDTSHSYQEFEEAVKCLCIQGENPRNLWLANEILVKQAKNHMKEGKKSAGECEDLITLIGDRFHPQLGGRFSNQLEALQLQLDKDYFLPLDGYWKIMAISLLNIIIQLFPFYDDKHVTQAIEGYRQAWDLMTFVENSDLQSPSTMNLLKATSVENSDPQSPNTINLLKVFNIESDRVSIVAYQEFKRLLKIHEETLISVNKSSKSTGLESALNNIRDLFEKAMNILESHHLFTKEPQQSTQGSKKSNGKDRKYCRECQAHNFNEHRNELALSLSMYKVSYAILMGSYGNVEDLLNCIEKSLGDVIADCLLQLPDMLVKSCSNWSIKFEEDKIWDAIYIAGKIKGIKDNCDGTNEAQFGEV